MRMEYIEHVTDIDQSQGRIEKWRHELPSAPGTEFNVRARVGVERVCKREETGICLRVGKKAGSYSFITKNDKQCCKGRWFTLNARGQKILNCNSMRDLVMEVVLSPEETTLTLDNPHKIVWCQKNKTIKPKQEKNKDIYQETKT